jgi:hypothetical protein
VLAAVSAALKAVVIPLVLSRLLRGDGPVGPPVDVGDIAGSGGLGLAATVLLAIAVAAFGFFAAGRIPVPGSGAPATALSVSVSVVLVAFVLMIHRRDVISQAIGLFSLENGISLAALVVAASRMRWIAWSAETSPRALMRFLQEEPHQPFDQWRQGSAAIRQQVPPPTRRQAASRGDLLQLAHLRCGCRSDPGRWDRGRKVPLTRATATRTCSVSRCRERQRCAHVKGSMAVSTATL